MEFVTADQRTAFIDVKVAALRADHEVKCSLVVGHPQSVTRKEAHEALCVRIMRAVAEFVGNELDHIRIRTGKIPENRKAMKVRQSQQLLSGHSFNPRGFP